MYQKYLELLEKTGKTTYQVCHETGVPESTISMWKKRTTDGKEAKLSIDNLVKIAKYFEVPIEYFLSEES